MRSRLHPVLAGLLLGGCSLAFPVDGYEVGGDADGGTDGGPAMDAGRGDAGRDAGPAEDAGTDAAAPARCTDVAHGCDLLISCSMPVSVAGSGQSVRVAYQVTNLGSLSGAGPFVVRVDMDHAGTMEEVGASSFAGIVAPLGMNTGEVAFVAPDWTVPGTNPLRCTVDADDEVPETDETNNTSDTSFVASGLPDLSIPFASIAGSPSNPFPATFDMRNSGPTATGPFEWLISGGGIGGGDTLLRETHPGLAAGETQRITRTVTHPGFFGSGTVFINLDLGTGGGAVMESNETNNSFTRNVTWP